MADTSLERSFDRAGTDRRNEWRDPRGAAVLVQGGRPNVRLLPARVAQDTRVAQTRRRRNQTDQAW